MTKILGFMFFCGNAVMPAVADVPVVATALQSSHVNGNLYDFGKDGFGWLDLK